MDNKKYYLAEMEIFENLRFIVLLCGSEGKTFKYLKVLKIVKKMCGCNKTSVAE